MNTTNDRSALKENIVEACINKQEGLMGDSNARIKTLHENDTLGNEEEYTDIF